MTNCKEIVRLIEKELEEANQLHPPFHSGHEAYAVIQEELEELKEEVAECYKYLEEIWTSVRADDSITNYAKDLKLHAAYAVLEALQVAAMCEKAVESEFLYLNANNCI